MIRFRFPVEASESVAFTYSPFVEAIASLHVLCAPKHHPLQHAWVRRMQKLDPALKAEIRAFRFAYQGYPPDFAFPTPSGEHATFEDDVTRVLALDTTSVAFEFLRPLYDHGGVWPRDETVLERPGVRKAALASALAGYGPETAENAALIFDDPEELARRFCELVVRYWLAAFEDEWQRLEPLLAHTVEEAGAFTSQHGVLPLLAALRPRVHVDLAANTVSMHIPHDHEVEITPSEPLVLSPSAFVWPHVRVNCDPPWPVGLIYPAPFVAREAERKLPSGELVRVLRAVSDETRLRALALIAEKPRSTQELAPLVGLTEAGLSKHLRQLADAGVVTTKRDGYYVLYRLVPERLEPLSAALLDFLGATRP